MPASMRTVLGRVAVLVGLLGLAPVAAAAQEGGPPLAPTPPPQQRLTIDDLLKIDVTSASKHAEPVGEAAAAISIIRQDDIRRAGITTLPDALRLATGVDVAQFDGRTWGISARGFDISTANKMVVLIDGRSVYTPLFSGVSWDVQDLVLDDIDRIEVIRGPGGALWGANAMNGVINIITKRPSDTSGLLVEVGGGNDLNQAAIRYGAALGSKGAYRVYGKYRDRGPQVFKNGDSAHDPLRSGQVGTRADFASGRTAFTLEGDAYLGRIGSFDRPDTDVAGGNILSRLTHTSTSGNQLQVQWYYDGTSRTVPRQFAERRDTIDADLQYRFSPLARHDVTAGAGVDVTRSRTTPSSVLFFDPANRTSPLFNVFAQDIVALAPQRLYLTVGSKVEHNDYTGMEYQPTLRLRWTPVSEHTLWGAVSRAVRMPTRFDTDLRFTGTAPIVVLRGDPAFASETVVAHEVGYRQGVGRFAAFSVTAFENDYDHLRSQEPTAPVGVPIVLSNLLAARTAGVELGANIQPAKHWEIQGAYSFLSERFQLKPGSHDPTAGSSEANDPAHEFSFRSFVTLPRHTEIDATVRSIGSLPHPAIPGYTELTLHLGLRPAPHTEIAVIGQNLLHPQHQEGSTLANPEEFVRSIFAQITWRF